MDRYGRQATTHGDHRPVAWWRGPVRHGVAGSRRRLQRDLRPVPVRPLGRRRDPRESRLQALGDHFEFHNILSTTLGALGRTDEGRGFGTQALILKDAGATAPAFDLTHVPVPPFDASDRRRNIIAFCLFGANPRYTDGAVLNVRAARFLYLGWTCRFYVDDSVPQPIVQTLMDEGAQVMAVRGLPSEPYGTFWRFLVADDPDVTRFLVRDADSVVNVREKVAVEEWLASTRHFHLMRDHYDHSELVLAGM